MDSDRIPTVDPKTGRTSCCNAMTSIGDDGVEYCKRCYDPVRHL